VIDLNKSRDTQLASKKNLGVVKSIGSKLKAAAKEVKKKW
jgi:hypothetical protein